MKIQIFCDKNPVRLFDTITLTIGYYAADYSLSDVTAETVCTINLVSGEAKQLAKNIFLVQGIEPIIFAVTYLDGAARTFQQEFSAKPINEDIYPSTIQLVNNFNKMLPAGYNALSEHNPADNEAFCKILYEWYLQLQQTTRNKYAKFTNNYEDWNYQLGISFNNNSNQILQLISNLPYIQLTPFNVCNVISKFIYLVTGKLIYVSTQEGASGFRGNWHIGITGKTEIGVTTTFMEATARLVLYFIIFDGLDPLNPYQQQLVINLCDKLARVHPHRVIFGKTLEGAEYVRYIGQTYVGDVRNFYRCAFCYDPTSPFFQSTGVQAVISNNINEIWVATPTEDLETNSIVPLTVMGRYEDGTEVDITIYCMYAKDPADSSLVKILPRLLKVGNNTGSLDVEFYLPLNPSVRGSITWNII